MERQYIGETRDPVVVILLSIVTCGIYTLFWYYTVTKDLNELIQYDKVSPGTLVVLCIFCEPVVYYVLYRLDKGLCEVAEREGIRYDENFIMWLLLSLVLGVGIFVAMYQVTSAFNAIWENRKTANVQGA